MDNGNSHTATRLFKQYVVRLVLRTALFLAATVAMVVNPEALDITGNFGIGGGVSFVNVAYALLLFDLLTKLRPHAKIAMGSRKQYPQFHVPTAQLFEGGPRELMDQARSLAAQGQEMIGQAVTSTRQAMEETTKGVAEAGKQFAVDIDFLRMLPWSEEDLTAGEALRHSIRQRRLGEIAPVLVFWVLLNLCVGLLLERFGVLNERTVLLWTLFYFMFDMVSVVLWCPLQLLLMRNRCCTTCQIFNWDGIMTATPLFVVGGWFGWTLIVLSLFVLLRWELAFARHPERFDERTNASLSCANCRDKLCFLRKPLTPRKL